MTCNSKISLSLSLAILASAGCGTTAPKSDGGAVSVTVAAGSGCGTTVTAQSGQGSANFTINGTVVGASVGSPVTLADNGAALSLIPPVTLGSAGTFTLTVALAGSASGTVHALVVTVTDSGGLGSGSSSVCSVTVISGSGGCALSFDPPNLSLFNETDGGQVRGKQTSPDEDLATPGIQAKITVHAANCTGPVSLTVNGGTPLSGNPSGGLMVFDHVTLPDTSIHNFLVGDGGDVLVANSGSASAQVEYFADSVIPTATIQAPSSGTVLMGSLQTLVAGITSGFAPDLAEASVSYSIVNIDAGANAAFQTSAQPTLLADGGFAATWTLINGTYFIAFEGTSLTGNPATSNVVQVSACITPTIAFGTGAPPAAPTVLNSSFDYDLTKPGFQFLLPLTTSASSTSPVTVCSTLQPPTPVPGGTCPVGEFPVGTTTLAGNSKLTVLVTLAQGAQSLSANVIDSNGCGSPQTTPLPILVHSLIPVIESLSFPGLYSDSAGRHWLNASNLAAGKAVANVVVTADSADQYSNGAAFGVATVLNGASAAGSAAVDGGSVAAPQGTVALSLSPGVQTYQLTAQLTDVWGNQSSPTQTTPIPVAFDLFVKTTLPSCTLTSPSTNNCFTVADNGGVMTAGAANLPVTVSVANGAGPVDPSTGKPIPGTAEVVASGSPDGGVSPISIDTGVISVSVAAPQGLDTFTGTASDPAGNPTAVCTGAFSLTVATVSPSLTVAVNADPTTPGVDGKGHQIYTTTRTVTANLTNTGAAGSLTAYIAATANGDPTSLPVLVASSATSVSILNAPNSNPGPTEFLVVKGTDLCGNPAQASDELEVNVTGCDLTQTSPVPTAHATGNPSVNFNAKSGMVASGQLTTSVTYHSSCTTTAVSFTLNGTVSSLNTDAAGNVTFPLANLLDDSTGAFSATISGMNGVTVGPIDYTVKLTTPTIGSASPTQGTILIVASQDNPLDGGAPGVLVQANGISGSANAAATFTVSGLTNLGPVDGSGNVGTAVLTATFPGVAATTSTQPIATGGTSVTFTPSNLPALTFPQSGTVTITVTDNAGNSVTQTWTVTTDVVPPTAPTVTAAMTEQRSAKVTLSWTVAPLNGASATQGYELGYQISNPSATPLGTPSAAVYQSLIFVHDAALATNSAMVGSAQTFPVSGLPTLNQYDFELRAIDAVGNRSPLVSAANTTSCNVAAGAPGICTGTGANTWNTLVLQGPGFVGAGTENATADFGFRMKTGDFNGDGFQDLAIGAPGRNSSANGAVYILPGAASYNAMNWSGWPNASLTTLALAAANSNGNDYFGFDLAVGDFNGDGKTDLAIGAPNWGSGTATGQGEVLIYFGAAGGLPANPSVTIAGVTSTGNFGWSVASLGDINKDGVDDLLIGAPLDGTNFNGIVYLYLGQKAWPAAPTQTASITGNAGDVLGGRWGEAALGDLDSDGTIDFAIGGPGGTLNAGDGGVSGNVYGISGAGPVGGTSVDLSTTTPLFTLGIDGGYCTKANDYNSGFYGCFGANLVTGNFTGGALPDVIVSSGAIGNIWMFTDSKTGPATPAVFTDNPANAENFGWTMSPADLNGDGKQDLLVGDNYSFAEVYLYLNTGTGFATPESAYVLGNAGTYFGYGTAAGDIRGGGKPDFAISDPFASFINIYY